MMSKGSILLLIFLSLGVCALKQPNIYCSKLRGNFLCKNQVEIVVANRLDSVESIVSYEYDDFGFCSGGDNQSLPYKFDFLKNENCHRVCTRKFSLTSDTAEQNIFQRLIKGMMFNYQQHWLIGDVPVKLCSGEICSSSFPIGCYGRKTRQSSEICNIYDDRGNETFYVFNHFDFEIIYRSQGIFGNRIIEAKIQLSSLNSKDCERNAEPMMFESTANDVELTFTYSVQFVEEKKDVAAFKQNNQLPEKELSICHSFFLILLLAVVIGLLILILLYKYLFLHPESIDDVQKKNLNKEVRENTEKMFDKDLQIGVILLIACVTTFLGSFSLLSPGVLILCCIIIFMMCDSVERWQRILVIVCSLVFILLFLLNRIPWKTDGLRDISFVGFLSVLYIVLIIAYAQATTLLFGFLSRAKNFNCMWRLCLILGFIAVYLFLYSVCYFATHLDISDEPSTFLYSKNTSIFIYDLFLLTGIIGFLACFWFIRTIYDSMEANQVNEMTTI